MLRILLIFFTQVYIEGQKYAGHSGAENCFPKEFLRVGWIPMKMINQDLYHFKRCCFWWISLIKSIFFSFKEKQNLKNIFRILWNMFVRWKNGSDKFCKFDNFAFLWSDVLFALFTKRFCFLPPVYYSHRGDKKVWLVGLALWHQFSEQ